MSEQHNPSLITESQTADMIGLKRNTLAIWRCENRNPIPFVKYGRFIRYRVEDVEAFIQQNMQHCA